MMKATSKYRFILHKAYFDKGWGLLSYFKYVFALIGLGSLMVGYSINSVVIGALIYGLVCYFLGRVWLEKGFYECELEVSNHFNKYINEMRQHIKKRKV